MNGPNQPAARPPLRRFGDSLPGTLLGDVACLWNDPVSNALAHCKAENQQRNKA
jgi:hypothetical protein